MLSVTRRNENAKIFNHHWIMTIPAHPSLRYIHTTVSHLDELLALISDPANKPYDEKARSKVWDDTAIIEWKTSTTQKYVNSHTKFDNLNMMIEFNGHIVGYASLSLLPTGDINIGLLLSQNARGQGLGKLSMQAVVQLAHNVGIERLSAGTMKANLPMRALMASLKIPWKDEVTNIPGRGIVAEIFYTIPKIVDWEDIDLHVEFGDPVYE